MEHTDCCDLPFFEIPDLFIIRRVELILFLGDPLIYHLVHLLSCVGQAGGDDSGQRYLRFQLFNPGTSSREFTVPFP